MTHKLILLAAVAVLALPGAAWARHGKAGLWSVTSTTKMGLALPPDVAARMNQGGMAPPSSHTATSQMCMSQAEVDASSVPHIDQTATGCVTKPTLVTPSLIKASMTCTGRLKGKGDMQINYAGTTSYSGSYDFKGTVEGNPTQMSTTFKGQWLKADCGSVKPYNLRTH